MDSEITWRGEYGQIEWHNAKTEKPIMKEWYMGDVVFYSDYLLLTVQYEWKAMRGVIVGQRIEDKKGHGFWNNKAGTSVTGEVIAWAYMPDPCTM